jgi:hypothetical protein
MRVIIVDLAKKKTEKQLGKSFTPWSFLSFFFIEYAYNRGACQFIIHKSNIKDIHPNITIESTNAIFFKDVFPFKEAQ